MPIRSRTRTTRWNLIFHYASMVLMMVSGILLVPLYLKYIPLELYGAWLATGNILMWLTAVDPGLSALLQQRIGTAYGKEDLHEVGAYSGSGLAIAAVISIALAMLGLLVSEHFVGWLNVPEGLDEGLLREAFWMAVLGSSLSLLSFAVTAVNQGLQSSLGIGTIYVVVHIIDIILVIILLLTGYGLLSLAFSALFRGAGLLIGNLAYLLMRFKQEHIGFSVSKNQLLDLIRLTPFTFLARFSALVATNLDAFLVGRFLGVELVPVLMLTKKAFEICRGIIERPAVAFMPAVSHLAGTGNADRMKEVLSRLLRMQVWILMLAAPALYVFNDDFVSLWVGSDLYAGSLINLLLSGGLVVSIVVFSLSNLSIALGSIKQNSVALVAQSILMVLFLYIGVKYLGLTGVVLAPLLAMGLVGMWFYPRLLFGLINFNSHDEKGMAMEVAKALAVGGVLVLVFQSVGIDSWYGLVWSSILFLTIYALLLTALSTLFRIELLSLYRKIASRWSGVSLD